MIDTEKNRTRGRFNQFRNLCQKEPGWGVVNVLLASPLRTASVAHPFKGEASPSRQARVTTHQLRITTYVALPNRPRRPYHPSFAPRPAMSPPPIPRLNPVSEDYPPRIHAGLRPTPTPTL